MGLLREIFGPSKEEVWTRLSNEIEADFVDGGFLRGNKITVKVKNWVMVGDHL